MAKNTGPLFSNRASGAFAKFLTFSFRKSGQQVRWQKKQKALPASADQEVVRDFMGLAWAAWRDLDQSDKNAWNDFIIPKRG